MDNRTKRQKLQEMADQSVSPNEAEIAKKKLDTLPPDPPRVKFQLRIRIIGVDGITTEFTVG